MQNRQKGFSLIELLIVVAIILIIAAIAIPNLLRSKMAANEASAVGSLRSINTACITYYTSYGQYPPTLAALGPPAAGAQATAANSDLLDSVLSAGTKSGYVFTYAPVAAGGLNQTYTVLADPQVPGTTGQRHFFTDQTGVIRTDPVQTATATSTPIG
jgi:prepilin-type N-terminal cleavage/methylation domain-containing protein